MDNFTESIVYQMSTQEKEQIFLTFLNVLREGVENFVSLYERNGSDEWICHSINISSNRMKSDVDCFLDPLMRDDHTALSCLNINTYLQEVLYKETELVISKRLKKGQLKATFTPIFHEDGRIRFVVVVSRISLKEEVTNRKVQDSLFYSLFQHNFDALFVVDRNGRVQNFNPSALHMLGLKEEELQDQLIYHFVHNEDERKLRKVVEENRPQQFKSCRLIHRNGAKVLVRLKTFPVLCHGLKDGIMMIAKDITEQWSSKDTIQYLTFHDTLTGLGNRNLLFKQLQYELKIHQKRQRELSLLYMDLDRFKYFNDTLGHKLGDDLLKKIANRLQSVEGYDYFVYRLGGDEFMILLKQTTRDETERFAKKLLTLFSEPFVMDKQEYYITSSIGISMYPNDGDDVEGLIKNADNALFRVKEKGRAHYQFYFSDMKQSFPNYKIMEAHLRRAIEKEELMLYFQPQVNLQTGKIESFEALLRWNNGKFGYVSPQQFIPLAEDTGLIIPIGEWVIENVCAQIAKWQNMGTQKFRIAVNISPVQLHKSNLPTFIQKTLMKYQVDPSFLEIEITEGAMENTKEALKMLRELKELGIVLSVDDFGTGYSSLNHLKRFPIDILKIDQTFVRHIQIDQKDAAITKTIIALAHNLGLEVVAEGVEEKEQVEFLLHAKCQKAQGYYFSRPVSALEIEQTLLQAQ
jgi:diguanylate cyclase (GGDEF)-like protein/PAS domain S-box-containing protein